MPNKKSIENCLSLLTVLLVTVQLANAFYLPGLAPKSFCSAKKASESCKVDII